MPGSVVSTRSSRSAASLVPSATTTIPAWIALPIPTPPPWCTLTQVAPAATLTSAFRIGQSAIASEPSGLASQVVAIIENIRTAPDVLEHPFDVADDRGPGLSQVLARIRRPQ